MCIILMYEYLRDWLVCVRRDFHQYPELGMSETRTAKKIAAYLKEMDIEYVEGIANTGVVGIIGGEQEGRTVALRADMDALPIQEARDCEYRSKTDGIMHACGHDAHLAILLGTAKALNGMKNNLKGNIKLLFQPAEETVGGAKPMIDEGVMENPHIDAVLGLHVDPALKVGSIGLKYGKMSAASDTFKIIIHGRSAHGAYPHLGIDAIAASAQVITALQSVISRNVDPRDSAVLTIGRINGGTAGNIICDNVELHGTIRTLDPKTREIVLERAVNIVGATTEALGAKGEFIRQEGYVALMNDDWVVDLLKANGEKLLGKDGVILIKDASMGVEDFSFFLEKSPGAYFNLGCRNEEKGITYGLHHGLFDIDEDCLTIGVAMMVESTKSLLLSSDIR